jgi:hypothetical protein
MSEKENPIVIRPIVERFVYAKPLKGDFAKRVYDETRARVTRDFKDAPAFNGYWEFNEQTGEINGSSNLWALMTDLVLRQEGLWIPDFIEAKALERIGLLTNGVYRDNGNTVYNAQDPNHEIAEGLVAEAERAGLTLPILLPFRALDIRKAENRFGVNLIFAKEPKGIISGQKALDALQKEFDYRADSGAHRLCRDYDGLWGAGWDGLGDSYADGQVDFVCGEATQKSLEALALQDLNDQAEQEIRRIQDRIRTAREAYEKALKV